MDVTIGRLGGDVVELTMTSGSDIAVFNICNDNMAKLEDATGMYKFMLDGKIRLYDEVLEIMEKEFSKIVNYKFIPCEQVYGYLAGILINKKYAKAYSVLSFVRMKELGKRDSRGLLLPSELFSPVLYHYLNPKYVTIISSVDNAMYVSNYRSLVQAVYNGGVERVIPSKNRAYIIIEPEEFRKIKLSSEDEKEEEARVVKTIF